MEAILFLEKNELEISVYLLDLGLPNIAYNEQEDRIIFIDIENVIVADKRQIKIGIYFWLYLRLNENSSFNFNFSIEHNLWR